MHENQQQLESNIEGEREREIETERKREKEKKERERYYTINCIYEESNSRGGNISKRNHRLRSGLLQLRLITSFGPISRAVSTNGQEKPPSLFRKQQKGHQTRVICSEE